MFVQFFGAVTSNAVYFLALEPRAATETPMPNSLKRSQSITQGARILVVDDDSDGAEAAGKLLETFGCNVSLVVSAGEALERIEEGADVDLVFSDVVMPDIDGLEFAERLSQLRPSLPVIFCTGYTSAVEALTDCGAMALMKPYSADVLHRVVAERLQLAREGSRHPMG
jgi:two-component system NtrC family sensor kinase